MRLSKIFILNVGFLFLAQTFAASAQTISPVGKWLSDCHLKEGRPVVGSMDFEKNGRLSEEWNYFNESDCSSPSMTVLVELEYSIGPESSSVPGAYMIDDTLVSTHIIPRSVGIIQYFNQVAFCGYRDWERDVSKEVTGLATCQMPSTGDQFFSLITIQGDLLFVGKTTSEKDANTSERRPLELDDDNPFKRVEVAPTF